MEKPTKPRKQTAKEAADRKRRIAQAEQQLNIAATSSMDPLNSQTERTMSSSMMRERKMVQPGTKDAPKFKSTKPEELRRFIRLMEDLWTDYGITDDEIKKSTIGKYADQDSEEEWSAFDSFEKGHSWEEFKEELIENYPEAAAAERGTPARLRQICAETTKIKLGDMPTLYGFRRAFLAEAKKLRKPPAAMANRELVELFIGCLAEDMASAVLQFLGSNPPNVKLKDNDSDAAATRRPEDKYDLEDVCRAAIQVSENSQGMFTLLKKESVGQRGIFTFSQPISGSKTLTDKLEELEGVQALEKDRVVNMNKSLESKIGTIEDLIKTLLAQTQTGASQGTCNEGCKSSNCKAHESRPAGGTRDPTAMIASGARDQPQKWAKSMENEKCFWCGQLGHFQGDCDDLKSNIRSGNIKMSPEGRLRLRDGSLIPNVPAGAPTKEKMERHYAKKPSQFFYGEYEEDDPVVVPVSKSPAQYLGTSSDAERRVARLEAELDLRKREEALDIRRRKLEQDEKKLEKSSGSSRAVNIAELLDTLTEEDLVAIKAAKSGFS